MHLSVYQTQYHEGDQGFEGAVRLPFKLIEKNYTKGIIILNWIVTASKSPSELVPSLDFSTQELDP
jgi:hypothetical protein